MGKDIQIKSIMQGNDICELILPNGTTVKLTGDMVKYDNELVEFLSDDGIENSSITIFDNYCVFGLTGASGQMGRTIVWDYVQNKIFMVAIFVHSLADNEISFFNTYTECHFCSFNSVGIIFALVIKYSAKSDILSRKSKVNLIEYFDF